MLLIFVGQQWVAPVIDQGGGVDGLAHLPGDVLKIQMKVNPVQVESHGGDGAFAGVFILIDHGLEGQALDVNEDRVAVGADFAAVFGRIKDAAVFSGGAFLHELPEGLILWVVKALPEGREVGGAQEDAGVLRRRSHRWRGIELRRAGGEEILLDDVEAINGATSFASGELEAVFAGAEWRQRQHQVIPLTAWCDMEQTEGQVVQRVPERVVAF